MKGNFMTIDTIFGGFSSNLSEGSGINFTSWVIFENNIADQGFLKKRNIIKFSIKRILFASICINNFS